MNAKYADVVPEAEAAGYLRSAARAVGHETSKLKRRLAEGS